MKKIKEFLKGFFLILGIFGLAVPSAIGISMAIAVYGPVITMIGFVLIMAIITGIFMAIYN